MRKAIIFLIILALTTITGTACALDLTGEILLSKCLSLKKELDYDGVVLEKQEIVDASFCIGFILGISDGYTLGVVDQSIIDNKNDNHFPICQGQSGIERKEIIDIIILYLRGLDASSLKRSASSLVIEAFKLAWPCKKR